MVNKISPEVKSNHSTKNGAISQDEARQVIADRIPGQYKTNCVCHDDSRPSLDIKVTEAGKVLTDCKTCKAPFAQVMRGFGFEDVPGKRQTKTRDTLPENGTIYIYHDATGNEVLYVNRYVKEGETKKSMALWTPTGTGRYQPKGIPKGQKIPLYRLRFIMDKDKAVIVEGEKDVETILKHKPHAAVTTSAMGTGSADRTDWTPLKGKRVTICMDADEPGRKHADKVTSILLAIGCSVDLYTHPGDDKSDITDWIEADGYKATVKRIKSGLVRQKPRTTHFDVGVTEERDFSIEVAGRQIGRAMSDKVCFYAGDYFMVNKTHWQRLAYDQQLRSAVAIEYRPRIIRELDERGWTRTKPEPDNGGYYTSPTLWGAFDYAVSRELERDRNAVAMANGIVCIEDNKPVLRPFDPKTHTNTSCSPLAFGEPSEDAMLSLNELQKQWFPGATLDKFIELISIALFTPNHRRILQILAPAATGKSTLISLLQRCFGNLCYSVSPEAIQQKSAHNEGLVDIIQHKPRFILISEAIKEIDAGLINAATGGELIRARRMRKPEVSGYVSGLPIIFREHPLKIDGETEGTRSRIITLKLNSFIDNPDPGLLERIKAGNEDEICKALLYQVVHAAPYHL